MNRKVLMVQFYLPPAAEIGGQITAKFAKYLPSVGWDPYLLAVREEHYTNIDRTTLRDLPAGDRVRRTQMVPHPRYAYLGLKRLVAAFGSRGGESPPTNGSSTEGGASALRRTLSNLLTVPDDMIGWIPFAVMTGLRMIKQQGICRLFSSGPPWTNHLVAYILKRATGIPWAACFEDPWTDGKAGRAPAEVSPASLAVERWLERLVVRNMDAVICLNHHHRSAMARQFPEVPRSVFHTISNGYDPQDFIDVESAPAPLPVDRFVIGYFGTIYYHRTPRHVFMAIRRLIDRGIVSPGAVELRFIGNCSVAEGRPISRMAKEFGLAEAVRTEPRIAHGQALRAMLASHLLLLLAHDWVLQVPAKAYEYLRVGRPILALAPEGATAEMIRASRAGTVVEPYDVDGIAAAFEHYFVRWKTGQAWEPARNEFLTAFDRRWLTAAFADLLTRLGTMTDRESFRGTVTCQRP